MEKEIDKNAVVLEAQENHGMVQIADDVVATIAALAACEVEGVCTVAGSSQNDLMGKVGMKKAARGVRVDVADGRVRIDIAITMEYGFNIPATCQAVQGKVKAAIENMTGLECTDVNIRIAAVKVK